ncbi:MAG: DoxX family protein [Planctomycetota bacterium]
MLATSDNVAPLIARAGLSVVMFAHGAQKLLGWFGGYGFEGTLGYFTGSIGLPAFAGVAIILLEFFGPLLLIAGLATRPIAGAFVAIMAGAVWNEHLAHGFFMNWSGAQAGEGFEFHILLATLAAVLVVMGGGRLSLDRRLSQHRQS